MTLRPQVREALYALAEIPPVPVGQADGGAGERMAIRCAECREPVLFVDVPTDLPELPWEVRTLLKPFRALVGRKWPALSPLLDALIAGDGVAVAQQVREGYRIAGDTFMGGRCARCEAIRASADA